MRSIFAVAALLLFSLSVFAQDQKAVKTPKVLRVPHDFKTIQKALDEADAGDTVFVDAGTYKEAVTMRDDIVLTGVSAELTIIQGNRKGPVVKGAQGSTLRNVTVEGGQTGVLAANVVMTIENCVIRGNRGTGIHCLIALPVIQNNIIFRNTNTGIFLETTRSHRGYVTNNVIAENNYSGINLAGQTEALIENNVFYFNKQYGVFVAEGAARSRIVSNVFFGNRQPGNPFANIDRSNHHMDPGYTVFSATGLLFWEKTPDVLKSRGREGKDIGAVRPQPYKPGQKPATTAKPAEPVKADKPAPVKKDVGATVPGRPPVAVDTVKAKPVVVDTVKTDAVVVDTIKTEIPVVDSVDTKAVVDSVKAE